MPGEAIGTTEAKLVMALMMASGAPNAEERRRILQQEIDHVFDREFFPALLRWMATQGERGPSAALMAMEVWLTLAREIRAYLSKLEPESLGATAACLDLLFAVMGDGEEAEGDGFDISALIRRCVGYTDAYTGAEEWGAFLRDVRTEAERLATAAQSVRSEVFILGGTLADLWRVMPYQLELVRWIVTSAGVTDDRQRRQLARDRLLHDQDPIKVLMATGEVSRALEEKGRVAEAVRVKDFGMTFIDES